MPITSDLGGAFFGVEVGSIAGGLAPFSGPTQSNIANIFLRSVLSQAMLGDWETMAAVCSGNQYIRDRAEIYLPIEPREPSDAWEARVEQSTLTPFTTRLIDNASNLVLRRPIWLKGGDDYWRDTFAKDVDGLGSSLNEYAKTLFTSGLMNGHSSTLVDYPSDTDAATLLEQYQQGARAYFVHTPASSIYGWQQSGSRPYSPLSMVRIREVISVNEGNSERLVEQIRLITPGAYRVYRLGGNIAPEEGVFSLNQIPLVPFYTNRKGLLLSKPLLVDVADINIAHYRKQSDRFHSLHLAAMQTLVLEGYEAPESGKSLGVNYAISMEPGNQAYWIKCDSGAFTAQREILQDLEGHMSTLGVTKLLGQKFIAESADAKRIDQAQANSVLALISMELETSLQRCFNIAAKYEQKEPPVVSIDRDFDFSILLGQDVSVLGKLHENGQLPTDVFVSILHHGEWLPDSIDETDVVSRIDAEMTKRKADAQAQMQQKAAVSMTNNGSVSVNPGPGRPGQVKRVSSLAPNVA
jgi:hypothetical protein